MVEAYIFVHIRPGWAKKIVRELSELEEVEMVNGCWGQPDIIAFVKVADMKKLRELVLQRFHRVEGIESTDTHIVVEL